MLRDRERECLLLDYYGELLTEHQYSILDEYFNEDLSMNEIADNYKISKSAVQDLIRRSMNQLNEYEEKLRMIEKDRKLDTILNEMNSSYDERIKKYAQKIAKIR